MRGKFLIICLVLGLAVVAPSMNTASASDFVTNGQPDVGPPHAGKA